MQSLKKIWVCEFTDLLYQAEALGYNWNAAHDYLTRAGFHRGNCFMEQTEDGAYSDKGENVEARQILKAYLEVNGINQVFVLPHGYDVPIDYYNEFDSPSPKKT